MGSIRIRAAQPADAGPIARVHNASRRTTYAGIMPADYLANLSDEDWEARWDEYLLPGRFESTTLVAETGAGEIVGFVSGGVERLGDPAYRGEIYAVYLLQDHQRQGVGKRLVAAIVQQLQRDGFASMLVWVLEDNARARRFYESMGGELVGRRTITFCGAGLTELSYGWKDIASLPASDPLDAVVGSVEAQPDHDPDAIIYGTDL